ncbi:MAG: hypothetical protein H0V66_12565 [Bdellovibrionales bacterium]|nr:hypothetical protein [Bdellovibrionales bacterium]
MSSSNHNFLAIFPLFAVLSISPMQLESKHSSRSIASEVVVSAHPKYEARAAKIDRTKIEIDKDLDLTCFSERGEALRTRLLQERKDYKVDVIEKDAVAAQQARLEGLVSGLVSLEVDMAALKEKKAWESQQAAGEPNVGEEIANKTMAELRTTLESLLQDEVENELAVLKAKIKKEEETPVVVKEEEKPKTSEDVICELEDKNKVLSKQVEDLLAEQKKIMETMLGMSNMMVQMNQRMQMPQQQQQQYTIPGWAMSGSLVNPYVQYPYNSAPTIIYMNGASSQQGPQLGQMNYQQNLASGQFHYPYQQQPQYQQQFQPQQDQQYGFNQPQYQLPQTQYYSQPNQLQAGSFGSDPLSFNFGAPAFI